MVTLVGVKRSLVGKVESFVWLLFFFLTRVAGCAQCERHEQPWFQRQQAAKQLQELQPGLDLGSPEWLSDSGPKIMAPKICLLNNRTIHFPLHEPQPNPMLEGNDVLSGEEGGVGQSGRCCV